jgi:hypothetical protein
MIDADFPYFLCPFLLMKWQMHSPGCGQRDAFSVLAQDESA